MTSQPRVSCLMVTANRKQIARRAILCFKRQTYPNKELVIIDDGDVDYTDILRDIPESDLNYIRIPKDDTVRLGGLRNLSLDAAEGDYLVQWDDDDWYHDDRITLQAKVLQNGSDACCLSYSLIHIEDGEFKDFPFIGSLTHGIPGSIMHVNSDNIRYPNYIKAEDTVYLDHWKKKKYTIMPKDMAYLFIRCYHGSNTWNAEHFRRRMRNSPSRFITFFWYRYVLKDLLRHPYFRMEGNLKSSIEQYLADSAALGIFQIDH